MSDATNQDDSDFRGNRESKRRDETVMLGQDSMSSMVDEAKTGGATATTVAEPEQSGTRLIILAAGAIVILLVLVALVYNWVS